MSKTYLIIATLISLVIAFAAGFSVATLRGERNLADYQRTAAQTMLAKQQAYEQERVDLEARTVQLRIDLDGSRAESDRLQQSVALWRSRAKTAESRFAMECLDVVQECTKRLREGETVIRWCEKALPGSDEGSGNSK
jgi:Tfp pilus assembly protein FimT